MKLYTGPTTPFGRKASVVARELRVALDEEVINVLQADFLDSYNPLRLIPTLVLDDGTAIYDSHVICLYLDALSARPTLYPQADCWGVLTRTALATGIKEAGVQRRFQMMLPEDERSATMIGRLEARIERAIHGLERQADALTAGDLRIDQIAAAIALEYTDFRYTDSWRKRCPRLARWVEGFGKRPSMEETRPAA